MRGNVALPVVEDADDSVEVAEFEELDDLGRDFGVDDELVLVENEVVVLCESDFFRHGVKLYLVALLLVF